MRETIVDVTGRFDYDMGDGRPARVPGLRATKTIPFRGEPQLWRMKTNPWGMNPPRGAVRSQTVTVGIEVPAAESEAARNYIEECVAKIPEYLDRQSAQIDQHNAGLRALVLPLIQQRRARLKEGDELRKKLQG